MRPLLGVANWVTVNGFWNNNDCWDGGGCSSESSQQTALGILAIVVAAGIVFAVLGGIFHVIVSTPAAARRAKARLTNDGTVHWYPDHRDHPHQMQKGRRGRCGAQLGHTSCMGKDCNFKSDHSYYMPQVTCQSCRELAKSDALAGHAMSKANLEGLNP